MNSKYLLKLDNFEGPFELLMHLIEKDKLDIYDIPIASVTEQYIAYINEAKVMDLEIASEFLVMASTLIQIKSKMLLPKLKDEIEEDPREELVNKLLEYKIYKEITNYLTSAEMEAQKSFPRDNPAENFTTEVSIIIEPGIDKLAAAFLNALKRYDLRKRINDTSKFEINIKRDMYTVQDKIGVIKKSLITKSKMLFIDLFDEDTDKQELITTFLALLEIIKLKVAKVVQDEPFSDIYIHKI